MNIFGKLGKLVRGHSLTLTLSEILIVLVLISACTTAPQLLQQPWSRISTPSPPPSDTPKPTATPSPSPTIEIYHYEPDGNKISEAVTIDVTAIGDTPWSPEDLRIIRAKPEQLIQIAQQVTIRECSSWLREYQPVIYIGDIERGQSLFDTKSGYSIFLSSEGDFICAGIARITTKESGEIVLETHTYERPDVIVDRSLDWIYQNRAFLGCRSETGGISHYQKPMLQNGVIVTERRSGICDRIFDLSTGLWILPPRETRGSLQMRELPSLLDENGLLLAQATYDRERTEWVWHWLQPPDMSMITNGFKNFLEMSESEMNLYVKSHTFNADLPCFDSSSLNLIRRELGEVIANRYRICSLGSGRLWDLGYLKAGVRSGSPPDSGPDTSKWEGEILGVHTIPVSYRDEGGNISIHSLGIAYIGMRYLSANGTQSMRIVLPFVVDFESGPKRRMFVPVTCSAGRSLASVSGPESYREAGSMVEYLNLLTRHVGDVVAFTIEHEKADTETARSFRESVFDLGAGQADRLLILFTKVYSGQRVEWNEVVSEFPYANRLLDVNQTYELEELKSLLFAGPMQICED